LRASGTDSGSRSFGAYRARLAAGHGYDDEHRRLLAALQHRQRKARNKPGGYWIAEADPIAARHALTRSRPWDAERRAILATDGAAMHGANAEWPRIAELDQREVLDLLHSWRE
jgi:hypothetical protein